MRDNLAVSAGVTAQHQVAWVAAELNWLDVSRATACVLQLCDGASPEERERWFLRPAQEFHYLNQSTCYDIPGDSNAEEYKVSRCPAGSTHDCMQRSVALIVLEPASAWGFIVA